MTLTRPRVQRAGQHAGHLRDEGVNQLQLNRKYQRSTKIRKDWNSHKSLMEVQTVHKQFEQTTQRSQQHYSSQPKLGNYLSSHQLQTVHCGTQSKITEPTTTTHSTDHSHQSQRSQNTQMAQRNDEFCLFIYLLTYLFIQYLTQPRMATNWQGSQGQLRWIPFVLGISPAHQKKISYNFEEISFVALDFLKRD